MYFVYILKSLTTNKYYKGLTDNLNRRIKQHFQGKVASTKHLLPLKVVHVQVCNTRKEARKLEKYFKSGFGRETIKELDKLCRDGGIGRHAGLKNL